MTINKTLEGGKLTLDIEGRLENTTSPQLQEVLIKAFDEANEIVLNFEKLGYVSSAGLRVLLMGQKVTKKRGVSMTLTNVSSEIMDVLEMTGFADMLKIV
ncbi:MAG: STAS domain-containing protein [Lachnospiraceae bacterium]|nr:STAS domain-containing protein [Lachnospiraceae bacterium]